MNKRTVIVLGLALLLTLLGSVTLTQARSSGAALAGGGGYEVSWYTIDGGGAMFITGGAYSLGGTIGQSDAGALSSGSYALNGGFWGGASTQYRVYLPLVLK
jgi:hypothetical protein